MTLLMAWTGVQAAWKKALRKRQGSALPSMISSRAEGIVQRSKTCKQRSVLRYTAQRPALWAPYGVPPMDFRFHSILSAAGRAELRSLRCSSSN